MAAFKNIDDSIRKLAHHNLSLALKMLGGEVKQVEAAKLLGVNSGSVISDYKEDSLERACQLLAAFNIRLVHKDEQTFHPAYIAALRVFAREGVDANPSSGWGDNL